MFLRFLQNLRLDVLINFVLIKNKKVYYTIFYCKIQFSGQPKNDSKFI